MLAVVAGLWATAAIPDLRRLQPRRSLRRVVGVTRPRAPGEVPVNDFAQFYAAQFHGITLQLFAYTGDLPLAQDIAQEAFTRAVIRWERVGDYDDPAAWVRRVAFNLAASRWRHFRIASAYLRRQREEHVEGPSPDRVALARALATLPDRHRRAVILYYLADLSVADIARQENVSANTVKSWLHRGRAQLAAQLGDQWEVRS
jgi:RNA polymerase sigma-70 factor (ECF subfamily)